jgi:type I restriction enzyme S subunit
MKEGWEIKTLGEVCIVERGSSPRPIDRYLTDSEDGVNWIKIGDTKDVNKYIYSTKEKITVEGSKKSRYVKEGDFILSNSMSFGKPYVMKTDGFIHDGWFVLRLPQAIDIDFFYSLLISPAVQQQIQTLGAGAIVKNISGDLVKKVILRYPTSLSEQQRIVTIIDKAFEAIDKSIENIQKNLQNAKELFESYLNGVFEKGGNWEKKSLNELYQIGSSRRVLKSQWKTEGIPFYRGREITRIAADGFVDNELYISEEHYSELLQKTGVPKTGDIVMTAIGTIGNTHIVRDIDRFYFKDASVLWLKRISQTNSEFIRYYLKSSLFFDQLDKGNGATVDTLTIDKLQNIQLFLPLFAEQKIIVQKLDALQAATKKLEFKCQQKLCDLEELKKSILNKAFAGEL